jgi:hypothetical protein
VFFAEHGSQAIVSVDPTNVQAVLDTVGNSLIAVEIGHTANGAFSLAFNGASVHADVSSLTASYSGALEAQLAEEVVMA